MSVERAARGALVKRLHVEGIDQGGPPFEARVFVNAPGATPETSTDAMHGYVGSIHVYGLALRPPQSRLTRRTLDVPRALQTTDRDLETVTIVGVRAGAPSEGAGPVLDDEVIKVTVELEPSPAS